MDEYSGPRRHRRARRRNRRRARATLWTDADRAWASRAAAEVVGERGAPRPSSRRRAQLALERLGERSRRCRARSRAALAALGRRRIVAGAFVARGRASTASAARSASTCSRRRCSRCWCGISPSTRLLAGGFVVLRSATPDARAAAALVGVAAGSRADCAAAAWRTRSRGRVGAADRRLGTRSRHRCTRRAPRASCTSRPPRWRWA